MLKKSSLERDKFKKEELTLLQKLDVNDISITMPENLAQLLIWTSDLAQYDHAMFIKQQLQDQISFYRKRASVENQTKDFYLNKLLNQGDAVVKGYIQHPTRTPIKYAIIPYGGYDFVTFATPEIIAKFPIHFIDFEKENAPQTLAEIHPNEEELFSAVKGLVKPFRKHYKEWAKKNKAIKENNSVVQDIYRKINNGKAELIKDIAEKVKQEVPKEKIAVPNVEETAPIQTVNSNEKPITVIKKRKFALVKDK